MIRPIGSSRLDSKRTIEEMQQDPQSTHDFSRQAELASPGFVREVFDFLAHSMKWWLAPIMALLLLVAVLAVLSSTAAVPLIDSLF